MNKEFIYAVYIIGNERPTLYTGVTNNLARRILEHKEGKLAGFSKKYNLNKLLWYDFCDDIEAAIVMEKRIKKMLRVDKSAMIAEINPELADLSEEVLGG